MARTDVDTTAPQELIEDTGDNKKWLKQKGKVNERLEKIEHHNAAGTHEP